MELTMELRVPLIEPEMLRIEALTLFDRLEKALFNEERMELKPLLTEYDICVMVEEIEPTTPLRILDTCEVIPLSEEEIVFGKL